MFHLIKACERRKTNVLSNGINFSETQVRQKMRKVSLGCFEKFGCLVKLLSNIHVHSHKLSQFNS